MNADGSPRGDAEHESAMRAVLDLLSRVQRDIDRALTHIPRGAAAETAEESPFYWLGGAGHGVKMAIDRLTKGSK